VVDWRICARSRRNNSLVLPNISVLIRSLGVLSTTAQVAGQEVAWGKCFPCRGLALPPFVG
jgi:hypothetical protein